MDAVWLCILRSYQNPRRSFTPEIWLRLCRAVFFSVLCVQLIPCGWLWSCCLWMRLSPPRHLLFKFFLRESELALTPALALTSHGRRNDPRIVLPLICG